VLTMWSFRNYRSSRYH